MILLLVAATAAPAEDDALPPEIAHPLLSIAGQDEGLIPPAAREEARTAPRRRLPSSRTGTFRLPGSAAVEAPTGRVPVDEQEVRAAVIRRLQRRIEARRRARRQERPASASRPATTPSAGDLQSRLQGALRRAHAVDEGSLPYEPPLPDDSGAVPATTLPSPPARPASPISRPGSRPERARPIEGPGREGATAAEDPRRDRPPVAEFPRGFVSPEELRHNPRWNLPEELLGREQGILPPEVTGEPTGSAARPLRRPDPDRPARSARREPESRSASASPGDRPGTHELRPGETLWGLARRYRTTVEDLMRLNGVRSPTELSVGRVLRVRAGATPVVLAGARPSRSPTPTRGSQSYRVVRGDTLFEIARAHGVTVDEVLRANPAVRASHLAPGMMLTIPVMGSSSTTPPSASPAPGPTRASSPAARTAPGGSSGPAARTERSSGSSPARAGSSRRIPVDSARVVPHFLWPVEGTVTSPFGWKEGKPHTGLDIAAPLGTPIRAAAAGKVIYSASMRGYGSVVILDHGNGFFTVYGNNQQNLVKKQSGGAVTRVEQGDVVARVGATGDAIGPQLHFEVRKLNQAVDPLRYLAPRRHARAGTDG